MFEKNQTIKTLKPTDNPADNKIKVEAVGTKLSQESNVTIKEMGEQNITNAETIGTSQLNQKIAKDAHEAATAKVHQDNEAACIFYNTTAKKVMDFFANDQAKWAAIGFDLTSSEVHERPVPGKVINCVMMQGEYPKQCKITFDPVAAADNFTVEITIADPLDASKYILVVNPKMIFTTSKITFFVPDTYLGKPLWAKVTAHNTTGTGPSSEPFGGKIIQ